MFTPNEGMLKAMYKAARRQRFRDNMADFGNDLNYNLQRNLRRSNSNEDLIKGALSAGATAAFGPVGGLAAGFLGNALFPQEQETVVNPRVERNLNPYGMAQGGMVQQNMVPVEVEGDEMFELPNGQVGEFDGPNHEQGGIPTALPAGTNVYSKRVRGEDGRTMADRKESREKRLKKILEQLKKRPADAPTRNAVSREVERIEQEEQQDMQIMQMYQLRDMLAQARQEQMMQGQMQGQMQQGQMSPEMMQQAMQQQQMQQGQMQGQMSPEMMQGQMPPEMMQGEMPMMEAGGVLFPGLEESMAYPDTLQEYKLIQSIDDPQQSQMDELNNKKASRLFNKLGNQYEKIAKTYQDKLSPLFEESETANSSSLEMMPELSEMAYGGLIMPMFEAGGTVRGEFLESFNPGDYSDKNKVREVQETLAEAGYDLPNSTTKSGSYDGVWGEETQRAYDNYMAERSNPENLGPTPASDNRVFDPLAIRYEADLPEVTVTAKRMNKLNWDNYLQAAEKYLSLRNNIEGFTPEDLVNPIKEHYEKTGRLFPLELLMVNMQNEGSFNKDEGRSKWTNPVNWGEYDSGTKLKFKHPQEAIAAYIRGMDKSYLQEGKVSVDDLMQNFVNKRGYRYATDTRYEEKGRQTLNKIRNQLKDFDLSEQANIIQPELPESTVVQAEMPRESTAVSMPMMQAGGVIGNDPNNIYNRVPRKGAMMNPDGSQSTHLMAREYMPDKGWVAFPTLFQNEDESWLDMSNNKNWQDTYKEALKRNEVFEFGDDEQAAIEFADKGNWKQAYQPTFDYPNMVMPRDNTAINMPMMQAGGVIRNGNTMNGFTDLAMLLSGYNKMAAGGTTPMMSDDYINQFANYQLPVMAAGGNVRSMNVMPTEPPKINVEDLILKIVQYEEQQGSENFGNKFTDKKFNSAEDAAEWITKNLLPHVPEKYKSPYEKAAYLDFLYDTQLNPEFYFNYVYYGDSRDDPGKLAEMRAREGSLKKLTLNDVKKGRIFKDKKKDKEWGLSGWQKEQGFKDEDRESGRDYVFEETIDRGNAFNRLRTMNAARFQYYKHHNEEGRRLNERTDADEIATNENLTNNYNRLINTSTPDSIEETPFLDENAPAGSYDFRNVNAIAGQNVFVGEIDKLQEVFDYYNELKAKQKPGEPLSYELKQVRDYLINEIDSYGSMLRPTDQNFIQNNPFVEYNVPGIESVVDQYQGIATGLETEIQGEIDQLIEQGNALDPEKDYGVMQQYKDDINRLRKKFDRINENTTYVTENVIPSYSGEAPATTAPTTPNNTIPPANQAPTAQAPAGTQQGQQPAAQAPAAQAPAAQAPAGTQQGQAQGQAPPTTQQPTTQAPAAQAPAGTQQGQAQGQQPTETQPAPPTGQSSDDIDTLVESIAMNRGGFELPSVDDIIANITTGQQSGGTQAATPAEQQPAGTQQGQQPAVDMYNFDKTDPEQVKIVQERLANLGYDMRNSEKADGTYDGVWVDGEQTAEAYNDWRAKKASGPSFFEERLRLNQDLFEGRRNPSNYEIPYPPPPIEPGFTGYGLDGELMPSTELATGTPGSEVGTDFLPNAQDQTRDEVLAELDEVNNEEFYIRNLGNEKINKEDEESVKRAQRALKRKGYDLGPKDVDGDWGPATQRAYDQYIKDNQTALNKIAEQQKTIAPQINPTVGETPETTYQLESDSTLPPVDIDALLAESRTEPLPKTPEEKTEPTWKSDPLSTAGVITSGVSPLVATILNRLGDKENINFYANYGRDAERALDAAERGIAGARDRGFEENRLAQNLRARQARNAARSSNVMQAMQQAALTSGMKANEQLTGQYQNALRTLLGNRAQFEQAQDQAVMRGREAAFTADVKDRDQFYTNLASNLANVGSMFQTLGRQKEVFDVFNDPNKNTSDRALFFQARDNALNLFPSGNGSNNSRSSNRRSSNSGS